MSPALRHNNPPPPFFFTPPIFFFSSAPRVARAFFLAGHIAVKLLAHAEALAARVRLLRIRASERAEAAASANPLPAAAASVVASKKSSKAAPTPAAAAATAAGPKDGIEDQLGAAAAAEDERETEIIANLSETELARSNLLATFVPLLVGVLESELKGGAAAVSAAPLVAPAALALAKLAAVCAHIAEANLRLLFSVQVSIFYQSTADSCVQRDK